jgi:hypothetical protein
MPEDFIMWHGRRVGNYLLKGDNPDYSGYRYDINQSGYTQVDVVDGFIMVYRRGADETLFRDDIFDGWHFYDVSMSFEIRKKGIEWIKLGNLIKADDPSPFPALTQIEVYGTESL